MRVTLTLEPDVAQRVRRKMKQKGISLKQVVNDALRAGLAETDEAPTPKFRVQTYPRHERVTVTTVPPPLKGH